MANISFLKGVRKLSSQFTNLKKDAKRRAKKSVVVGYTANYAVYVHENKAMKLKGKKRPKRRKRDQGKFWDPQGSGQAKFLEEPARTMQNELGRVIAETTRKTGNLEDGLYVAGLRLQRASQKLVPVNTGNLKSSAFTRVEAGQ